MDDRELLREVEQYAQALSRAADQHSQDHRIDDDDAVSPATIPGRRTRSALVVVVVAAVLAAGTTAALVAVNRSSTPHRSPPSSKVAPRKSSGATAAELEAGTWSPIPPAPVSTDRESASIVWTGHELIVWGGATGRNHDQLRADGAAYNPSTHTWRVLPASPLSGRVQQAAVWTGTELVIWGGYDDVRDTHLHATNDGAAYDPATDTWRMLPAAPILPRVGSVAVWTGSEVVVLGGRPAISTPSLPSYADGAAYDPTSDTWRHIDPPVAPDHDPVTWQLAVPIGGNRVLAWSVWEKTNAPADQPLSGAGLFVYDNTGNGWTHQAEAAGALANPQEVLWTGKYALVRGQIDPNQPGDGPGPTSESTARYDPTTNSWTAVVADAIVSPSLSSAWTGRALFSYSDDGTVRSYASAYDPETNTSSQLPRAPHGCGGAPVWTGTQVLIVCIGLVPPSASGLAYTPGTAATVATGSTTPTTSSRAGCTQADLDVHGDVPVPSPQVVTHHIAFHSGSFSQVDPPSSTQPAITAAEAWQMAQQFAGRVSPVGTYEMMLGDVSSTVVSHRLAWLIIGRHVPTTILSGPSGAPGVTGPPQPPCYFAEVLEPVDANTGQTLFIETGDLQAP